MRGNILIYTILGLLLVTSVFAAPRLTNVDLTPEPLVEGKYLVVSYDLRDTQDLGRVITNVKFGDEVNWQVSNTVKGNTFSFIDAFPLPKEYAGTHEFSLLIQTPDNFPTMYEAKATVKSSAATTSKTSGTATSSSTTKTTSVSAGTKGIDILVDPEVPNVARGEWIYWPVTIKNTAKQPITTTIGVEEVKDWASYRIEPQATITIQPGEQKQSYIYMSIDSDAYLGLRPFTITAKHDGVREERIVSLAVLKPVEKTSHAFAWILIAIAILLLLGGVYLLSKRTKKSGEDEDEDFITYY